MRAVRPAKKRSRFAEVSCLPTARSLPSPLRKSRHPSRDRGSSKKIARLRSKRNFGQTCFCIKGGGQGCTHRSCSPHCPPANERSRLGHFREGQCRRQRSPCRQPKHHSPI